MTKLSVNVNKLALIRNSREKNNPDLEWWGRKLLSWGSHGLTVHPRPDGRHIRAKDVIVLSELVRSWNLGSKAKAEFNIEGYPSENYFALVKKTRPDQCTLVPDPPEALTSNAGWDFVKNKKNLKEIVARLKDNGCRVSLFLEPANFDEEQADALAEISCDRIELYTEAYADAFETDEFPGVLNMYLTAAGTASELDLGINAGHDLNQKNLGPLIDSIPEINEVSIGHALTCEALVDGFEPTVKNYLKILAGHGSQS